MFNQIDRKIVVLIGISIVLTVIYYSPFQNSKIHSSSHSECSNELTGIEKCLHCINRIFFLFYSIISSILTLFSYLKVLSPSFILYAFVLYIFHSCLLDRTAIKTVKLLYIVNIICYVLITLFYTSFKDIEYTSLAWLIFIFLCIRIFIH